MACAGLSACRGVRGRRGGFCAGRIAAILAPHRGAATDRIQPDEISRGLAILGGKPPAGATVLWRGLACVL